MYMDGISDQKNQERFLNSLCVLYHRIMGLIEFPSYKSCGKLSLKLDTSKPFTFWDYMARKGARTRRVCGTREKIPILVSCYLAGTLLIAGVVVNLKLGASFVPAEITTLRIVRTGGVEEIITKAGNLGKNGNGGGDQQG